jgi:hypothetical protein
MQLSASALLLVAKQHEIEELRRLAANAQLVGVIGRLVHALQTERGATSIFLGSQGERFEATRTTLVAQSQAVEQGLRARFTDELLAPAGTAKLFTLMAWALVGLDELPVLRERIVQHHIPGGEAVQAFSRLIGGLVSLIFEVADAALDPGISRLLVALFNLVQGKELAGQERALGGLCFGAKAIDTADQDSLTYLIDAQERCFQLFAEFADEALVAQWNALQDAPVVAQIERLRRTLFSLRPGAALDDTLNQKWFDRCSERLDAIWSLQSALVDTLQARCATLIGEAERSLQDVEGLLSQLREHPPAGAESVDGSALPTLQHHTASSSSQSLVQVLRAQSDRLTGMQSDLDAAKRALNERKLIERAKGVLMERFQISEEAAHVMMRKASMDQNLRLVDIAQAGLSLPAFLPPARKAD